MKNYSSKIRSLLTGGARAIIITSVLLGFVSCSHGKTDTDNQSSEIEVTTICTTVSTTSTETTSTTFSTTTSTSTTTTVATTSATAAETIAWENTVQTEPEPTTVWVEQEPVWTSEDDVILLAKLINHEASASYDGKVMVGSCVVNRMNATGMSVSEVIFEPYQFTTANNLTDYTDSDYQAAQQVLSQGSADTRIYYFDGCHPDGLNHFRDINNNYLGAW